MGMLFVLMVNVPIFLNGSYGYIVQTDLLKKEKTDLKEKLRDIKSPSKYHEFKPNAKKSNKKAKKAHFKDSIKQLKKTLKAKLKAEKKNKKKKDGTHLIILRVFLIILIGIVALISLGVFAYLALFGSLDGWLIAFYIFLGLVVIFLAVVGIIWVSKNVGYY